MTILMNGINGSGGGSSGTTNYNALSNKPQINGVTLQGNKSTTDLNIIPNTTFTGLGLTVSGITAKSLITALVAKNLPSGSFITGGVSLTDFPDPGLYNAELTVNIKDSILSGVKVYDLTLSSTTTAPYIWYAEYRTDIPSDPISWVSSGGTGSGANIDLSNLSATGEAHFLKSSGLKTVDSETLVGSGNITIKTYKPFPTDFITTGTLQQVVASINGSTGAIAGAAYVGTLRGSCLPWAGGGNAECKVEFLTSTEAILTLNSVNVPPYSWEYNSLATDYKWKKTIAQFEVMPTNDLGLAEGVIVQYVGVTSANYTNGYFYKCVSDGQTPAAYSWTQVNVQPGGGGGSYTAGTGIDITNNVISNTGLINTATGTNALTILGTATTVEGAINIGKNSVASSIQDVAIGYNAQASGGQEEAVAIGYATQATGSKSTAIGSDAHAYGNASIALGKSAEVASTSTYGIAMGFGAQATATRAIQLGRQGSDNAINSDAETFKVANVNGNFELMSADGTIPKARLTNVATVPATMPVLTVAGWSSSSQTISVTGVTTTNVVLVSPAPASASAYGTAGIICTAQGAGTLTFTCTTTPTTDITVNVVIL